MKSTIIVKGCVKRRQRAEGRFDARLGFPFLIIMLVSVHETLCNSRLDAEVASGFPLERPDPRDVEQLHEERRRGRDVPAAVVELGQSRAAGGVAGDGLLLLHSDPLQELQDLKNMFHLIRIIRNLLYCCVKE